MTIELTQDNRNFRDQEVFYEARIEALERRLIDREIALLETGIIDEGQLTFQRSRYVRSE